MQRFFFFGADVGPFVLLEAEHEEPQIALVGGHQCSGAATLARQQDICATLEATASTITEQTQRSSEQTLAEISRCCALKPRR